MKQMLIFVSLSAAALTCPACVSERSAGLHYLGEAPPGMTPQLFAPGVVNTDAIELNGVLSPDGREFFFTRIVDGVFTMHRRVLEHGKWSEPRPLSVYEGGEKATAVDMTYSPDGRMLYFLGRGSTDLVRGDNNLDLWIVERVGDGWSKARLVPPPVSTEHHESYPCVVGDGSLYFSSRRPGGFGEGDLYVSFRDGDGGWSEPVNLGEPINSEHVDFCPMVTPDGRYLFLSRRWGATWDDTTRCEIYWVDARVLERFRP